MPVRSSLCTYSPMAAASNSSLSGRNSSASKYSSVLPAPSSYGLYKSLSSSTSARSSYPSPSPSSSSSISSNSTSDHRYNRLMSAYTPSSTYSSSSSYSPGGASSTINSTGGNSVGLYKPLSLMRANSKYASQRHFSSSSSTGSLTSTSSSGSDQLSSPSGVGYQSPYKSSAGVGGQSSPLSTSAYSSGSLSSSSASSSTSSSSSASSAGVNNYSSPYSSLRQSRFLSSSSPSQTRQQQQRDEAAARSSLPPTAPSGLMNLGNTCYMNASLQALYALDSFRSLLLSSSSSSLGRHHQGAADKPLTSELSELFKLMRDSADSSPQPLSPANFKFAFARHQSKFAGFGQQDAQEFLRYLIDGIHEENNAASRRPKRHTTSGSPRPSPRSAHEAWAQYRDIVDDSPLVELLVGQLCSTITCRECRNKSHCWDPFWDLSLPLSARGGRGGGGLLGPGSSSSAGSVGSWRSASSCSQSRLSDVIDEFTSEEVLDSDERPNCAHCKRPTKSTKQISLARLPRVLILHLKKFTNDGYKLSSPELQIDKHLTFNNQHQYRLKACISHHGHSSSSGHYTSHCEYASRWLHFDDGRVRDVTSTFDCGKLDDAYVLFYTQQQTCPRRGSSPPPPPPSGRSSISQSKL